MRISTIALAAALIAAPAFGSDNPCGKHIHSGDLPVTWGMFYDNLGKAIQAGAVHFDQPMTVCVLKRNGKVVAERIYALGKDYVSPVARLP